MQANPPSVLLSFLRCELLSLAAASVAGCAGSSVAAWRRGLLQGSPLLHVSMRRSTPSSSAHLAHTLGSVVIGCFVASAVGVVTVEAEGWPMALLNGAVCVSSST